MFNDGHIEKQTGKQTLWKCMEFWKLIHCRHVGRQKFRKTELQTVPCAYRYAVRLLEWQAIRYNS